VRSKFTVNVCNDTRHLDYLLFEIKIEDDHVLLKQASFVEKHTPAINPTKTPLCTLPISEKSYQDNPDLSKFGKIFGLSSNNRPHIAFSVSISHHRGTKRILRYLNHSKNHCIRYEKKGSGVLEKYVDSDLGGTPHHKSTTGFIFLINGGPFSCRSTAQNVSSTSTLSSENISLYSGTDKAGHLRQLLKALDSDQI
jgi:hypothetical protein